MRADVTIIVAVCGSHRGLYLSVAVSVTLVAGVVAGVTVIAAGPVAVATLVVVVAIV